MRRVLVLDDDPRIRRLVVRIVAHLGFEVSEANNVAQALGIAGDCGADLLITDYHLPDMDGVDGIAAMREVLPGLRVLLISGSISGETVAEVRSAAGADAALAKPFEVSEFRDVVSSLMDVPAGAR